jgi:hypothetical protein
VDAKASLKFPMDSASLPSVSLIETARVRETVAPEYSVSGWRGPGRLPVGRRIHGGMDWGAAAHEKNGATTS